MFLNKKYDLGLGDLKPGKHALTDNYDKILEQKDD